ncbi:MAG: type III-B CRISPR module RAMP protein Cmr4 [Maritimibacter sp.]|nr:type III-B CRISPR module RAMP protein Cmr4 [Maritimibacter sp.]
MINTAFFIHALSPLHAGVGSTADVIDLPIARYKSTGIPFLPGSSIKGVLRDARDPANGTGLDKDRFLATFGPKSADASDHAGAIMVGDARLLALPVRSFKGTFAWVTSPLLLRLTSRDIAIEPLPGIPSVPAGGAFVTEGTCLQLRGAYAGEIVFQDIEIPASADPLADDWAKAIGSRLFPEDQLMFSERFAIVTDEIMTFLWETGTQVDTRIRIDPETRTVASGAMWQEESLPPETLLIGLMGADQARRQAARNGWGQPADVQATALPGEEVLQFGGKASVGRGRCRILPVSAPETGGADAG